MECGTVIFWGWCATNQLLDSMVIFKFHFLEKMVPPTMSKNVYTKHSKYCGRLQLGDPTVIMNSHIIVWWKSLWSNSNFGLFIITVVL
jgi:hypothetical protein